MCVCAHVCVHVCVYKIELNFLLPFTHLKSNLSNFHEQCFLMFKKKVSVPGCKSSILSMITKIKKNKTETMSNLTLKIVPMF